MENEVSSLAKLGIVLLALAVLIGIGFGIFQISKGSANTGSNNVQNELDVVNTSEYSNYDQTTITGQMLKSSLRDFDGQNAAILIANNAWVDFLKSCDTGSSLDINSDKVSKLPGVYDAYMYNNVNLPIILAYANDKFDSSECFEMTTSKGNKTRGAFINYNTLLGGNSGDNGTSNLRVYKDNDNYSLANIFFDKNCFRCLTGLLSDENGRTLFNAHIKNLDSTGSLEFIPTGSKFNSYLVKDMSGTILGFAAIQSNL